MRYAFSTINTHRQGSIAVLLSAFLWGTTGAAASFITHVNPMGIGAFSMGIGGLLLAITARTTLRQDWPLLIQSRRVIAIGTLALVVYPQAFYSSMHFAGVAIGNVVSIASAPFMAVILERLFIKSIPITFRWLLSAALGTLGIVMLTVSDSSNSHGIIDESSKFIGILLGLLAALAYAGYTCAAKQLLERGIHSKSSMGSLFGCASLLLLPSLWFTGQHLFSGMHNAIALSYLALIPMFLGYLTFGYGLRFIHASKATLLTLFEPVVAVYLAVLIVGEVVSPIGWCGMGLIIVCLLIQASEKDH